MQSVVNKVGCSLAALLLSVACCLGPYAQAAYANTAALTAGGTALASVLAVYGINVANSDGTLDPAKLWTTWTGFLDDVTSDMVDEARSAAIASNPDYFNNVLAWDQGGREKIEADFIDWGQTGTIPLDALSISQSGALGLIPFLLSLFMADQTTPDIGDGTLHSLLYDGVDYSIRISSESSDFLLGHDFYGSAYDSYTYPFMLGNVYNGSGINLVSFSAVPSSLSFELRVIDGIPCYSLRQYDVSGSAFYLDRYSRWRNVGIGYMRSSDLLVYPYDVDIELVGTAPDYKHIGTVNFATGHFTGDISYTDNPDVNLGHDYWDDAKDRVDVLNPSAGAAVIGADAVIDGDYIANRGSLGVITDWADINSWADALARAHAGVAEGALDGTISTTQTGTAIDVGTGELVTDTVGELVKPGGNTSISPAMPGLFDGVIDAVSDKFPFCIPGDLHKCLLALGAAPVAPSFDWTFSLHHVGLTDVTIHIDLAPFDQVAMILRVCLSVTMTIGLIFLSIRLLNMWGGH